MRFAVTSVLLLMGLLFAATAVAGNHEKTAGEAVEAPIEEMPPVQASPPDTPIASPASPGEAGDPEAAEEGGGQDD